MRFLNCMEVGGVAGLGDSGAVLSVEAQTTARNILQSIGKATGVFIEGIVITKGLYDLAMNLERQYGTDGYKTLSRDRFTQYLKDNNYTNYTISVSSRSNAEIAQSGRTSLDRSRVTSSTPAPVINTPAAIYEEAVKTQTQWVIAAADGKVTSYVVGADGKVYWKDADGYGISSSKTVAQVRAGQATASQEVAPEQRADLSGINLTGEVAQAAAGNDGVNPNLAPKGTVEDGQ
jgi:hypothetical protein